MSSICSVFSLLSHFIEPQVPISEDSISSIDSTIFAPVASAIFSISEESNSPTVNIELSDNKYNISLSTSPVQNTVLAPLLIIAFAIVLFPLPEGPAIINGLPILIPMVLDKNGRWNRKIT